MSKRDLIPDCCPELNVVVPLFDEKPIFRELHQRLDQTLSATRVLDVGCGRGVALEARERHGNAEGDVSLHHRPQAP